MRTTSLLFASLAALLSGCLVSDDFLGPPSDPPPDPGGPPPAPSQPPATGSKWQGLLIDGECGRQKLAWVMVDEVCGGTEDPAYMDYFRAPIVRDGAELAGRLYSVDASYLWVLDATQADAPERKALLSGFGEPLALAVHNGKLLIAAGDEGLIVADVSDPDHPVRAATVALDGPALDVSVHGDRAYLALGHGGVAVVNLATQPVLEKTLDVPGFAAAVSAVDGPSGEIALVAACDTFATIDVATNVVLGQTWVDQAYDANNLLIAPAKDVEVVGSTAFVAAGRYGAVAIDISDAAAPALRGNCTKPDDLDFYASGVRASSDGLFIAGGEYGIVPVDVSDASVVCTSLDIPAVPPPPTSDEVCSTDPPWAILPWSETWSPPAVPPEGRDPLQTLPVAGRVYAFGDATRIGVRAIDVRDPLDLGVKLGRYSEPRLTEGIAAYGGKVLVAGKAGGLFDASSGNLVKVADIPEAAVSRAAAFFGDGRWVLAGADETNSQGSLYFEGGGGSIALPLPIWAGGLTAKAATAYVADATGVLAIDDDFSLTHFEAGREGHLPASIVVSSDHLLLATPEWPDTLRISPTGAVSLGTTADGSALGDVDVWRKSLPRRSLVERGTDVIEVASLGGAAKLSLRAEDGSTQELELPGGDYLGAALVGDQQLVTIAVDRARYRTQLVVVDLDSLTLQGSLGFTGAATGIASDGGAVYVADGDRGVRVYDVASGTPALDQLLELSAP